MVAVSDGVFEVLPTSGCTHLVGDDFDKVRLILIYFVLLVMVIWFMWLMNICLRIVSYFHLLAIENC